MTRDKSRQSTKVRRSNLQVRKFTSSNSTMIPIALFLSLATFNVRGLSKELKQHQLGMDCMNYNIDIVAIQETKMTQFKEIILPTKNKLLIFEQSESRHGDLGFLINERFIKFVMSWNVISDRVAYINLKLPSKNGSFTYFRIVNAYCPHSKICKDSPTKLSQFYDQLQLAIDVPSRWEIFVLGDFNSKLGKLTSEDINNNLSLNVGKYGNGTHNDNGETLLNFLISNHLSACNTAFKHKSRHITTYTGQVKDHRFHISKNIYSQIDYVLCRTRTKCLLQNSRSYAGTITDSDHKLVVTRVDFGRRCASFKRQNNKKTTFECSLLSCNSDNQITYQQCISETLENSCSHELNANDRMLQLQQCVKTCATKVIGRKATQKRPNYTNDHIVVQLSQQRHKLRLQLNNNDICVDKAALRREINLLKNKIKKRLKALHNDEAKHLAEQITSTDSSRQMFEAMRQLANVQQNTDVHIMDNSGEFVANDQEKCNILKDWFEAQFTNDDDPLTPFDGPPSPLDCPITPEEVTFALRKFKNGRAAGPDEIPSELLKYAGDKFSEVYASIINQCFETNTFIDELGKGILSPLQKLGKPKGPLKSIRPLTLSNGVRKLLSLITLNRIQYRIDDYTGPWQAGYKTGRSCCDLVWSQRMLLSIVLNRHFEYHKMGIDMSAAFDTIRRPVILTLLRDAGFTNDEIKLVRILMSQTKLRVRVNNDYSIEFMSLVGAFQGDSLSGKLFTLYLAAALVHLRALLQSFSRNNPPIANSGMPEESEYADDVDFLDTDLSKLQSILPVATSVLKQWNLNVNEQKTEFIHVYLANKADCKPDGTPLAKDEEWRVSKLLGLLLCSTKDILHRINLGNIAFNKFKAVWIQGKRISLNRKIQIYEAQVVSVIMYGSSSRAAPKYILEKLDICHRKHLRHILNYRYPYVISNKSLYERCNTVPLSERVRLYRWRMLGHVLRSPENSPAQVALTYAVDGSNIYKSRRGRHQTNLFNIIRDDLSKRGFSLKHLDDIFNLRSIASNRQVWQQLYKLDDTD